MKFSSIRSGLALLLVSVAPAQSFALTRVNLSAEEITGFTFSAKQFTTELRLGASSGELRAAIAELGNGAQTWRDSELTCAVLSDSAGRISCRNGKLKAGGVAMPLSATADARGALTASLKPLGENWQIDARQRGDDWSGTLRVDNGALTRIAWAIPNDQPKPSKGVIDARLDFNLGARSSAKGRIKLSAVDFADTAGLRAGEKIGGTMEFEAARNGERWRWNAALDWQTGEVFWQPLYFAKAGNKLSAAGWADATTISVAEAKLELTQIGTAKLAARWNYKTDKLTDLALTGKSLDLAALHAVLLKPFLENTILNQVSAAGKADIDLKMVAEQMQRFDLALKDAALDDGNQRFKLEQVNASIPWVNGSPTEGVVNIAGARLWNIPIAKIAARPRMNGFDFSVPALRMQVVDGTLDLMDFQARRVSKDWVWEFRGDMTPISLPKLTKALGWPEMAGTLQGIIPRVHYAEHKVAVDGALQFKVFDGIIVATNLLLEDPFGAAPRLRGDVVMSNLDLETLTKTFSFGKMLGRIDVAAENMVLSNWRPVYFDGRVMSSPGDYPRKISQQAVQNISSLGGAGATAAIQRSFLRIFEQFGYRKIGLICKLRNHVCQMGGVADTPQGYVIVQGGGIPAITVMGYNRTVGWEELLNRVRAATQSNVKPVVQ